MPEVGETKTVFRRIAWLLILINLSVPAFVFFQRNGNNLSDTANIWVGWISATVVTAMLVVGTYLRLPTDRRQIPRSIVLTSLALVVLSGLITTISIAASPSDNYLAVALSDTPLNKIKPDRKRLVVELIRQNKAASNENSRIAKSMKPISPALYSGDSFASKAAMESTSSQLKQAYDIDQAYAAAKHQARQDFHDKMQRVDPDYLRGFESRMQDDDALEASIEAEEAKWVASALSLYDFAATHASGITVDNGGHLVIATDELKQSLLQQINASTVLEQTMMNDRVKAVKNQHTIQDAMGMKHSD
ncbi:MAG TPA: hypothetical protein VK638_09515 [Edaphobacter sp.]|nr:hypothetical protein [Edaphobacter sp.]